MIAAVLLLHERSMDEIVPKLSPAELEKVIVLVGRSPRLYPPGIVEALERRRRPAAPVPAAGARRRRSEPLRHLRAVIIRPDGTLPRWAHTPRKAPQNARWGPAIFDAFGT